MLVRHCFNFTIRLDYTLKYFLGPIRSNIQQKLGCQFHQSPSRFRIENSPLPRLDYTLNEDVARWNRMISKLSKEGRVDEARQVFDMIPDPDVISWTAMISGYLDCGMTETARDLFNRVDSKKNVVTWTAMVCGLLRNKQVFEAERLFDEMPEKNVVSWNTMLNGYIETGHLDKALDLFRKMEGKNVVSWNMVLSGLAQGGRINEAKEFFHVMPERNVISWTTLIAGLSRHGAVNEARMFFDRMPEKNAVSWNAMITGYIQNLKMDEALNLFKKMPNKKVSSWNTMITGLIQNGNLQRAMALFDIMPRRNIISWTIMINGYAKNGQSEEALRIFLNLQKQGKEKPNEGTFVGILSACSNSAGLCEGMQIHQLISKSAYQESNLVNCGLVNMYAKCGELGTARKLFDEGVATQRDLVFWNAMITAYGHHGYGREAINLFSEMEAMELKPNEVTYVGLLAACSHAGLIEDGLQFFKELLGDNSVVVREDHLTCLVDLCSRGGRLLEAMSFIDRLPFRASASTLVALLAGCNVHGDANAGSLAADKLLEVESEDAGAYLMASYAYAVNGNWNEAAKLRTNIKVRGYKKQPGCSWIEVGNRVHVFVVSDSYHPEMELIHSVLQNLHLKMRRAHKAIMA